MEQIEITAEFLAEVLLRLREKFANDPAKLKYVDANELSLNREPDNGKRNAIWNLMQEQLEHWDEQPNNPLLDQEVDIKGFAKLLSDIKEYESDTFSASGAELSEAEVVLIANQLVDNWKEAHLDGVQIAAALDDIRAEDEFGLEMRGFPKKQ